MQKQIVVLGILGLCSISAAMAFGQEHTKDSLESVQKALAAKKAVLIDVREVAEWEKGRLKDAKLLPLSRLNAGTPTKELELVLPKDKIAYLHCAAGGRCLKATEILRKQGFDVRPLKEGYKDLLKAGFAPAVDPK